MPVGNDKTSEDSARIAARQQSRLHRRYIRQCTLPNMPDDAPVKHFTANCSSLSMLKGMDTQQSGPDDNPPGKRW